MLGSWPIVAPLATFLTASAIADDASDEAKCLANANPALAACGRLIEDGRLQGEKLAVAHAARARAFQNARRLDEAIADYDKAIALAPSAQYFASRASLIPTLIDQNSCAHLRMPSEMMRHGLSIRVFQA